MKTSNLILCVTLLTLVLISCEDEHQMLDKNKKQTFEGSFKLKTDDKSLNTSATSTLEIENGYYKGYTYDGNVHAAGKLEITSNKITFTDTVFKGYLMHIFPPRVLNGTYDYAFDGNRLEIGTKYGSDWSEIHTLHLKK